MENLLGTTRSSKNYGDYKVVGKGKGKYLIEFTTTKYTKLCDRKEVVSGAIKDPYSVSVYSIGYLGKGKYTSRVSGKHTTCYRRWILMIGRCYNSEDQNYNTYGERGITVCKEWHNYQCYAEWFYSQVNSDSVGFVVDKDIRVLGNLIYSENTCAVIPEDLHKLLNPYTKGRGKYPLGVTFSKGSNKYVAECENKLMGESKHLGYFTTAEEASLCYINTKSRYIVDSAEYYFARGDICEQVYQSLLSYQVKEII